MRTRLLSPARHARRLNAGGALALVTTLLTLTGGMLWTGTAFAGAPLPEAPQTTGVKAVTSSSAVLEGVLNPHAAAATQAGWYFAYSTEIVCAAGATTPLEPEEAVKAKPEQIEVKGLEPNKEYTFCMVATNEAGAQATPSTTELKLKTEPLPPEVTAESEHATSVTGTGATLEAQVNPNNEKTQYFFEYATTKAAVGTAGATKLEGAPPAAELENLGAQGIAVPTTEPLEPHKTYYYRIVAENEQSKTEVKPVEGAIESFTTGPLETPEAKPAKPVGATTATLNGLLNPGGAVSPGSYEFVYEQSESTCEGEHQQTTPAEPATGAQNEPAEAKVENLLPHTAYTFCLRADHEGEATQSAPVTFTTLEEAPTITGEQVSGVTSTEATITAQLDPGGAATEYWVEYEPNKDSPVQNLPASPTAVPVRLTLSGLTAATSYEVRLRAKNASGPGQGAPLVFTTAATTAGVALALPDNRVYELVSAGDPSEVYVPAGGIEEPEEPPAGLTATHFPLRAAAQGDAVAYAGAAATSGGNGFTGEGVGNDILATRDARTGWRSTDVTPEISTGSEELIGASAYEFFSSDLSFGILSTISKAPFAATATPQGPAEECGVLYRHDEAGFHALFGHTQIPGDCGADLAGRLAYDAGDLMFAGASAAGSQLLFQTPAPLTPETTEGESNLYDSVNGHVSLVNLLPGSTTGDPNATFGGTNGFALSNVIAANGSRAFWSEESTGAIYERVNPSQEQSKLAGGQCVEPTKACTIPVSAGTEPAQYQTATPDGRYVYYTEGGGLWRFNTEPEVDHEPEREQLTPGASGVQGVVAVNEAGEDGTYVYFVADGALATNTTSHGETATPRACELSSGEPFEAEEQHGRLPAGKGCNLYLLHGGETRFIDALTAFDAGDWGGGLGVLTAQATPDGQHLAFESRRELTSYHGEGNRQVFVYDAESAALSCASCNPSGTPPVLGGVSGNIISRNPTFAHRWISEDGNRVFFETSEALVSQDANGVQDVYEWERPGEGTCTPQAASAVTGGCTFLLSGANNATPSYFADADATGNNVFFTHRGKLGEEAPEDGKNDLYDARVEGGFPHPSLSCTGTGCQGTPAPPPIFATPSSVTADGPGNPPPPPPAKPAVTKKTAKCPKGQKRTKHHKCVKTKKSKNKSKQAKRVGRDRRGNS